MVDVDNLFQQLKKEGKNNLDYIINWMKDANVVDDSFTEEKAKNLYEGVDSAKLKLADFRCFLTKVANERKTNVEELQIKLTKGKDRLLTALKAGYDAFSKSLSDDDK